MTVVRVVKFGGSIVGDRQRLRRAAGILARSAGAACLAIASAPGEWTDEILDIARSGPDRFPRPAEDLALGLAEEVGASLLAAAVEGLGRPVRLVLPSDLDWPLHLTRDEGALPVDWSRSRAAFRRLFEGRGAASLVVMPGFVGLDPSGDRRTLARGGGDTSAVIAAGCLGSHEVSLVKDVPGLLAADPRVVPSSETIAEITVEDASVLAAGGVGVVAPEALACLTADQVLRVVSVDQYEDPRAGTRIRRRADLGRGSATPGGSGHSPLWDPPTECPAPGAWTLVTGLLPSPRGSPSAAPEGPPKVCAAPVHYIAPSDGAPQVVRSLHASRQFRALAHRPLGPGPCPSSSSDRPTSPRSPPPDRSASRLRCPE